MYVTLVTRRLGDSDGSMWSYISQTSWKSLLENAATAKVSSEQVAQITSECAANNFKAGAGRITMDQAKAQCERDINAVVKLNGGIADEDLKSMTRLLVFGLLGVAAVGITVGIATR